MGLSIAKTNWLPAFDGQDDHRPLAEIRLENPQPRSLGDMDLYIMSRTGSFMWHKSNSLGAKRGRIVFWDMADNGATLTLPACNCVLLVDIDIFPNIDTALDWLETSRQANPHVPVVILSEQFTYDDLSVQRMAFADASVRTPSSLEFIANAIHQAVVNNKHFQSRAIA